MPADRGRYPPPAVDLPSLPAGCLVPGLPLPQARRSWEIMPPARLWLNARRPASDSMPAGPPLTQCPPARLWLNAANPSPWIESTRHGQECRVSVLLCPQEHFKEPCLVHGDSSGAGGSCEGPWCHVMPRGSLSFQASPGGLPVPESCPVLSVWPWRASLSCLYCPACLAPEGSWYPLTSPGKFLGGIERVPAVGAGPRGLRPRPRGPSARASRAPSSAMASFVCLFRSGGPRPVFLSVFVLRGLQSAHPPSLVELLQRGTRLPGGGSYVRVLLCVSSVHASCVHIWFVSCPCFMSLWVKYVPAVLSKWLINYLNVHLLILLFRHMIIVAQCVNKCFINTYSCCDSWLSQVVIKH